MTKMMNYIIDNNYYQRKVTSKSVKTLEILVIYDLYISHYSKILIRIILNMLTPQAEQVSDKEWVCIRTNCITIKQNLNCNYSLDFVLWL